MVLVGFYLLCLVFVLVCLFVLVSCFVVFVNLLAIGFEFCGFVEMCLTLFGMCWCFGFGVFVVILISDLFSWWFVVFVDLFVRRGWVYYCNLIDDYLMVRFVYCVCLFLLLCLNFVYLGCYSLHECFRVLVVCFTLDVCV